MTNQAAVSDSYIVRKIIQALYQKGVTPTAEELLETIEGMKNTIQDLGTENTGLERTLKLLNEEVDGICDLFGNGRSIHAVRRNIEAMLDRCRVLDESKQQGLMPKTVFLPVGLDMATADLIGSFAENLGQRLNYKQRQGYTGWSRDDWKDDCLRRLHTSDKPLDVAAFAVFAWYHDWSGSYEALVTMPGEFTPGETTVVHNHNITINIEGSVSGFELSGLLANYPKDDGPLGFRTE